jgi:hypothetical protein
MTGMGDAFRLPRGAAPLKAVQMQSALPGTADLKSGSGESRRFLVDRQDGRLHPLSLRSVQELERWSGLANLPRATLR